MEHTLVTRIRNDPAALTRVVSLLRRRGFDILSMVVGRSDGDQGREATMVVAAPDVRQVLAQLLRLVDVLDAKVITAAPAAARDRNPNRALSA
ncbi:MAG: ACT domain-containing protein [Gemmatimonadota bacterium]